MPTAPGESFRTGVFLCLDHLGGLGLAVEAPLREQCGSGHEHAAAAADAGQVAALHGLVDS